MSYLDKDEHVECDRRYADGLFLSLRIKKLNKNNQTDSSTHAVKIEAFKYNKGL